MLLPFVRLLFLASKFKGNDMTNLQRPAALFAVFSLAACGGGSTSTMSFTAEDQALRVFTQDAGDLGEALEAGNTLASRAGVARGIQLRFDGGSTNLSDANVTIRKNDAGEITATLNGQEQIFTLSDRRTESDGNTYGYEFKATNGTTFGVYHFDGTLEELLAEGNGYGTVVSVMGDLGPENDTLYNRSFAAIGSETRDAALNAKAGSAIFEGDGRIDLYAAENFIDSGSSRDKLRGDVTLTADFDSNQISGTLDNLTLQKAGSSDRNSFAGQIDLNPADFGVNIFEGSVTGDQNLAQAGLSLAEGSYTGSFYGPKADEVHGVIDASGTLNGTDVNMIGYFTQ